MTILQLRKDTNVADSDLIHLAKYTDLNSSCSILVDCSIL